MYVRKQEEDLRTLTFLKICRLFLKEERVEKPPEVLHTLGGRYLFAERYICNRPVSKKKVVDCDCPQSWL